MDDDVEQTTETQETEVDIREEMEKSLVEDSETPVEVSEDEQSTETDEESEDKEDKGEEEEEGEKKKPNRYQKLKAREEAALAQARKHAGESQEALKIANTYRLRYLQAVERLREIQEQAVEAGWEPNPLEDENWTLKQQQRERELQQEFEKKQYEESVKQEMIETKQNMAAQFQQEALTLANKSGFKGDEARQFGSKVLRAYAFAVKAGEDVTMQDVASNLLQVIDKRRSAGMISAQHRINGSAPKPIKPGHARTATYDATPEGMESFLKSLGE
jgi:hypothetical protein